MLRWRRSWECRKSKVVFEIGLFSEDLFSFFRIRIASIPQLLFLTWGKDDPEVHAPQRMHAYSRGRCQLNRCRRLHQNRLQLLEHLVGKLCVHTRCLLLTCRSGLVSKFECRTIKSEVALAVFGDFWRSRYLVAGATFGLGCIRQRFVGTGVELS
jgi:hypothetical protein